MDRPKLPLLSDAAPLRSVQRAARVMLLAAVALLATAMVQVRAPDLVELRRLYAGKPESWPRPVVADAAAFVEFAPLPPLPPQDPSLVAIGARLFDDPKLSRSGQIACASCHARELGFTDGLRTSFGHDRQRGRRSVQSLFTVGWITPLFWDGRAATLEAQALHPITDDHEMAATFPQIERRVNADPAYRRAFAEAGHRGRVTRTEIASALASFQRSLRPPRSRFDRLLAEGARVLDDQQLLGLHLFRTKAGCSGCHSGPLLSDGQFHNLGLSFYGRKLEDLGRWEVTRRAEDVGRFRTPSLRGTARTAPFMHNGLFRTLPQVVAFYNGGGGRVGADRMSSTGAPRPLPDPQMKRLDLSHTEQEALVAFLEML